MKRKYFSSFPSGLLILLLLLTGLSNSCSKKDQMTNVDFTIDVTDPQYSQLNSIGGSVVINGVIIAKDQYNNYVAVSSQCTYDGSTLTFIGSYNQFIDQYGCGSKFNTDGTVEFGAASQPLVVYHTQLIGSQLRVYL